MVSFRKEIDYCTICYQFVLAFCYPILTLAATKTTFTCYTCSYIETTPPVHYQCTDEPWNVTVGLVTMPCDETRYCVTKTVYSSDRSVIKSAYRSCGTPETFECGENCCQGSVHNYACQYQCQSNLCNNADETVRLQKTGDDDNNKNGNNSPLKAVPVHTIVFAILVYICLIEFL